MLELHDTVHGFTHGAWPSQGLQASRRWRNLTVDSLVGWVYCRLFVTCMRVLYRLFSWGLELVRGCHEAGSQYEDTYEDTYKDEYSSWVS